MTIDASCAASAVENLIKKVRTIETRHREVLREQADLEALAGHLGLDKTAKAEMRSKQADLAAEIDELKGILDSFLEQSPEGLTTAQVARELSAITNELLIRATKAARLNAERIKLTNELDAKYRRVHPDGTADVDHATKAKALLQSVEPLAGFDPASSVAPAKASLDGVLTANERGLMAEVDDAGRAADEALRKSDALFRTSSEEFSSQVYGAMLGLKELPARNGSPAVPIHAAALQYAAKLREIEARFIDRLQRSGVPFHVIENHTKRSYAIDKLKQNAPLAKEFIEKHVDLEAMGFDSVDDFFGHMTGMAGKSISDVLRRSYGSSLMSGHQFHRKVQFKSQAAEFEFFSEFGAHTAMHYTVEPLRNVARASAVASLWGNGGLDNLRQQFYMAVKAAVDENQMTLKDAKSLVTSFHNRIDAVTGRYDTESSPRVTATKEGLAAFTRAAMLVRTAVYSFTVDPVNIARRSASFKRTSTMVAAAAGMPETQHLGIVEQIMATLGSADGKLAADQVLANFQLAHGTSAGEAIRRFESAQTPPGGIADVPEGLMKFRNAGLATQSFVMRSNLLQMGHRFNTRLNTMVNLTNIAQALPLTWSQLQSRMPVMHHRLAMFGISNREWDAMRAAGVEKIGNASVPNARVLEAQDPAAFTVLRAYLDADVQHALSIPGSTARRWMMFRQNPRDIHGAVVDMMMMFQSWTVGFYTRTLPTMIREARIDSSGVMQTSGRVAASAASLVAAGWVATQMQQLLAGKPMYAPDSGYGWSMAFANSGFAVVMAEPLKQIAMNVAQGKEMDVGDMLGDMATLSSPVAGYLGDVARVGWNAAALAGEDAGSRDYYKRMYKAAAAANRVAPMPVGVVAKGFTDAMLREWFFDKAPRAETRYKRQMSDQGRMLGSDAFFGAVGD